MASKRTPFIPIKQFRDQWVGRKNPLKTLSLAVILLPMMGCTVTSLSCGTDGASSYINLESKDLDTQTAKTLADLCNFSQEKN